MPAPPPPDAPGERPIVPLAAALWAVALTMLWTTAVSLTEAARPGADADVVNLAACQVLATSVVLFAMVRLHAAHTSLRAALSLRPIAPLHVPLSVAAGAGLVPLLSTVDDLIARRWPVHDTEAIERLERVLSGSSRARLFVAGLVVVPIARELFYRGILYRGLRRSGGVRSALVVTTVLYACSDLDVRQMPTALALGLAVGWLRERTGTVVSAVLAQIAFASVEGLPILLGRDPAADVTYAPRWIAGGAAIAALALAGVGVGRREG